jgi:hypothetical protein
VAKLANAIDLDLSIKLGNCLMNALKVGETYKMAIPSEVKKKLETCRD